jgi:hypothetical protein
MHVVKFNPVSELAEHFVPPPQPSSNYLPSWYKNMNAFHTQKPEFSSSGYSNATAKMCMPFKDALSSGYIQESWQDIYIEIKDGTVFYSYPTQPEIISVRSPQSVPIDTDLFYGEEFSLSPQWAPKLPRGWSMLFLSPLNHHDLPFFFASGIVDSDKLQHFSQMANLPFYIKKGFQGLVPRGTPLYQMIPIKRSAWMSSAQKYDKLKQLKTQYRMRTLAWGGYKKEYWQKKEYK